MMWFGIDLLLTLYYKSWYASSIHDLKRVLLPIEDGQ